MFNNNGIYLKNHGLLSGSSGTTRYLRYSCSAGTITYADGTTNTSYVYAATGSSDFSAGLAMQYMRQLNITGAAAVGEYITSGASAGYLSLRLGYRATPFSKETYTALARHSAFDDAL